MQTKKKVKFTSIKGSVHQEDIIITNIHTSNRGTPKYIKSPYKQNWLIKKQSHYSSICKVINYLEINSNLRDETSVHQTRDTDERNWRRHQKMDFVHTFEEPTLLKITYWMICRFNAFSFTIPMVIPIPEIKIISLKFIWNWSKTPNS